MAEVVDAVVARAAVRWGTSGHDRHDVVWRHRDTDLAPFSLGAGPGEIPKPQAAPKPAGTSVRLLGRLAQAGVGEGIDITERKPEWMRAKANFGAEYREIKKTMRDLHLVTVCEEAGCPNISECWSDGTATFMINGERCTRACGFCLVDTRHPTAPDPGEPERVAEAVEQMGLRYAVLTTVARDDLADGGASQFAATIDAIRRRTPGVQVETLISDCKGDPASLDVIFEARPESFAASTRNFGLEVRAGAPRRNQVSSLRNRLRRRASSADDCLERSALASTYAL